MVNSFQPPARLADFWLPVMAQVRSTFGTANEASSAQAAARLVAALDQAAARAHEYGFDTQTVQQALFAVVAWIDEIAMTTQWPGAHAWRLAPLQRRYFATTRAGVQFFQHLDALEDDATAVREVYALVLTAGFQGHYGSGREGELAVYRRRLLERLQVERDMAPTSAAHPLFPGALPAQYSAHRYSRRTRPLMAWMFVLGGPVAALALLYWALDMSLASQVGALFGGLAR